MIDSLVQYKGSSKPSLRANNDHLLSIVEREAACIYQLVDDQSALDLLPQRKLCVMKFNPPDLYQ